ncbi:hypothetical protein FAES_3658 [Fibrella aestuarina BUZ 2]|uniref:Uncharacterized protein n=1 Tax=Fibrella aestuarina BUZ 2 TaxID=1166018 RepID=I0KC12_9BACT|nr:hypothetical protein [Fibrella aestuarina]CCH01665.1 hypothetical protein FAES_3658 [Fibrella aestuarina BUZ 2]
MASPAYYESATCYITQAEPDSLIRLLSLLVVRYHCGEVIGTAYDWAYRKIIERLTAQLATADLADVLTQVTRLGEHVDQQIQQYHGPIEGTQLSLVDD